MKTITFKTATELKRATRIGFGFPKPQFRLTDVKSINGYNISYPSLEATNTVASVYDIELQGSKLFYAPYEIILR